MKRAIVVCLLSLWLVVDVDGNCIPCDQEPWAKWTSWDSCAPKDNDLCNKVITRKRFKFFGCDCRVDMDERPCQQCEQSCSNGDCSCRKGYVLNQDKLTCSDIDECQTNKGGCQHSCANTVGSFICSCDDGFKVSSTDQTQCSRKSCPPLNTDACPVNSYKDSGGSACKNIMKDCTNGELFQSSCTFKCSQGYTLSKILQIPGRSSFGEYINETDSVSVASNAICILGQSLNVGWNADPSNYYCRRNNDAPRYLQLRRLLIKEYEVADTVVGYLSSYDEENDIKYSVESSAASTFFYIAKNELKTSKMFVLKDMSSNSIILKVRATDNTNPSLYVEKSFRYDIINVNDPPKLIKISNNLFNDLTKVGDVIGNLTAVDYDDKPLVRSGSYKWELAENPNDYFKLMGNLLMLDKPLPDDNKDITIIITIKCTDFDKVDPKSTVVKVILLRKNKNNPVQITQRLMSPIPESSSKGRVVGSFRVVDDEGDMIVFNDLSSIETKSKFNLTNVNCSLVNETKMMCDADVVLIGYLDFESQNEFLMKIEAVDEHQEISMIEMNFIVIDVNEKPSINFKDIGDVPELSSQGFLVGSIVVDDPENNVKECSIVSNNSPFLMRGFNIILHQATVDFETKKEYIITVKCVDDGNLETQSQTTVFINDVNEIPGNPCPPSLPNIDPKTIQGAEVLILQSIDPDNSVLKKQKISYSLENIESPFRIIGDKVVIQQNLQPKKVYTLQVVVKDDGILQRKNSQSSGLTTDQGQAMSKTYSCIITTKDSSPCKSFQVYKEGLCLCPKGLLGSQCDRDPSRCDGNPCSSTSVCSSLIHSPQKCIETSYQLPLLLSISSSKVADPSFNRDLENYIRDLLDGNVGTKSLTNLKGTNRKRRSNGETFYVEIGEQLTVSRIFTYVKFIPYRTNNYTLTNNSLLCPKFDNTDVRCINEADCAILEGAGITCKPTDSRQIGVGPIPKKDEEGPPLFTYVIPIALVMLLAVVVLFLLYRRKRISIKKGSEHPVVFNNFASSLSSPALNNDEGQTYEEIQQNIRNTNLNEFDSQVFKGDQNNTYDNPKIEPNRNLDPNAVNYRENRAFVEDSSISNPVYASIGKSAKNPLYQESVKRSNKQNINPKVVDLSDDEKLKEKENALVEDVPDTKDTEGNRERVNLYDPNVHDKNDKDYDKENID